MTRPSRVWLFNWDAERELARPRNYSTPRRVVERIQKQEHLGRALSGQEPVLDIGASERPEAVPSGTLAVPWCPTPSALAKIRRLGLREPLAPSLCVLQQANHRGFQHDLARRLDTSPWLSDAVYVERGADIEADRARVLECVGRAPSVGSGWHLERAYGAAGRGARRISREPDADDVRWIEDSLRQGGVVVEPCVDVVRELCLHGWVDASALILGDPCTQVCDRFGAPMGVRRLLEGGEPDGVHASLLRRAAEEVAARLRSIGYLGPFGIDALVWKHRGTLHVSPLCDLNARFTLGWSTGMGDKREEALSRLSGAAGVDGSRGRD